ncbi:uncharacterized protein LOC141853272 [Brevipalpus obovatus]|uniref:uncharacterized protein LOC141853272 n=1 Tax=Brevipalpus obovatus TaxID=246614 RepID=UPI003D9F4524
MSKLEIQHEEVISDHPNDHESENMEDVEEESSDGDGGGEGSGNGAGAGDDDGDGGDDGSDDDDEDEEESDEDNEDDEDEEEDDENEGDHMDKNKSKRKKDRRGTGKNVEMMKARRQPKRAVCRNMAKNDDDRYYEVAALGGQQWTYRKSKRAKVLATEVFFRGNLLEMSEINCPDLRVLGIQHERPE